MSDSITARVIFNVFKGTLLFIGLILLCIAWMMNSSNLQQDAWPVTKGKIFYSQTVEKKYKVLGRDVKYYDLNIKYGYVVNKIRYNKKGLFVEGVDKTLDLAFFKQQENNFKKGQIVKVHYNPENPKQAYLVADIDSGTRSFYSASKKIVYFSIFLFLITPLLTFIKNRRFVRKNTVAQEGLVVPDDARRIQPIRKHR